MGTSTASVAQRSNVGWGLGNTYSRLPGVLFTPAEPAAFRAPRVAILNHKLADELGLDLGALSPEAAAALFAGQDLPAGSLPIAQAYAGHVRVPQSLCRVWVWLVILTPSARIPPPRTVI